MISATWLQKRRPYWERLEELLKQAQSRGLSRLSHPELRELGLLYRQTAADLSAVRVDGASSQYTRYLNNLLALAHNITYSGARARVGELFSFYRTTFPQTFRRTFRFTALAFGIFAFTAVLCALLTYYSPEFVQRVVPQHVIASVEKHEMWTKSILGLEPMASSDIMTHNLTVTFVTFAGGITFGILTVLEMVVNGLNLGVIGTLCATHGMSLQLWSFIAAHGSLELPTIFISGGAGLRIAYGMLVPGYMTRKAALARAGRDAMQLIVGCIPLLVMAGILEGFLSPQPWFPAAGKFLVGGALFAGLVMWLATGGKSAPQAVETSVEKPVERAATAAI